MPRLDDTDKAFIDSLLPDGEAPLGVIAIIPFIDADGEFRWRNYINVDLLDVTVEGLLDRVKDELRHRE